jgi:phasin family protein
MVHCSKNRLQGSLDALYFIPCCGAANRFQFRCSVLNLNFSRRYTMTGFTPEQIVAAQKASLETLFGLTGKAFDGVEKLLELNLQVARTTLSEAAETAQAALSVKDAQELLALQASLLQPAAEKAAAYSRHLYDIVAGTNAEVSKATEATLADSQKKVLALVDSAVKNAPAGTESAVALVKSAVAAANNAYESVHKAAKQAAEVAEANFEAVTTTAVNATKTAAQTASKGKRTA